MQLKRKDQYQNWKLSNDCREGYLNPALVSDDCLEERTSRFSKTKTDLSVSSVLVSFPCIISRRDKEGKVKKNTDKNISNAYVLYVCAYF